MYVHYIGSFSSRWKISRLIAFVTWTDKQKYWPFFIVCKHFLPRRTQKRTQKSSPIKGGGSSKQKWTKMTCQPGWNPDVISLYFQSWKCTVFFGFAICFSDVWSASTETFQTWKWYLTKNGPFLVCYLGPLFSRLYNISCNSWD